MIFFRQLVALVAVRIRLSRNQQLKVGKINFYLSRVVYLLLGITSFGSFLTTAIGGAYFFGNFSEQRCYTFWSVSILGFVIYWLIMFVGQIQQTETISFEKLLHLPLSVKAAFFLNYLSSYANSATWLCCPFLFGLSIGMIAAKGAVMWKLFFATLAILLLMTALSYQIRGWFAGLMQNKRLKSFVLLAVPLSAFMLLPLSMLNTDAGGFGAAVKQGLRLALKSGPSYSFILGILILAAASLYLSYRSIIKRYFSNPNRGRAGSGSQSETANQPQSLFWNLPLASNQVSTLALSTIKNLARSAEVLAAVIPLGVLLFFGSPYLFKFAENPIPSMLLPWIPIGLLVVAMLGFPAFLFSMFSYDRDGFRAYLLPPVKQKDVLLGKNVGIGILTFVSGLIPLVAFYIAYPGSLVVLVANVLQIPISFLLISLIGNFLSINFPVGLKRGTMQPVNAPVLSTVLLYVGILVSPAIVVVPSVVALGVDLMATGSMIQTTGWIYLAISVLELLFTMAFYFVALRFLGINLWQQQTQIINIVTNIPE